MKQTILTIALLIATGSTLHIAAQSQLTAQNHRHTPRASVQIDAQKNGNNTTATIKVDAQDQGIDAYSDTTDVDTTATYSSANYDEDEDFSVNQAKDAMGMLNDMWDDFILPIVVLSIIFVIAPVLIIGLICYYLYKSRKQKIRLAELALEKGQPIPDGVINDSKAEEQKKQNEPKDEEQAAKGLKYVFFGLGVAILGLFIDASVITGIGFLVTFMGAGQFATAYMFKKKEQKKLEWRQ